MNKVILMGRLTRDTETRYLQNSNNSVTRFTLAVERAYKAAGEERKADFINCVAWNKTGEFIGKYFHKGDMLAIEGAIETGSYTDRDGKKVYTTDVRVSEAHFAGGKKETGSSNETDNNGFMNIPDGIDDDLPFN